MIDRNRKPAAALAVTIAGLAAIALLEGTGPTVKTEEGDVVAIAYADPAHGWSVPTICNGHTKGVFKGQTATLGQCGEWLIEDAGDAGRAIKRCTPVEFTQGQYDSLVSMVLNIGGGAYCSSAIARKINAGDCYGAAKEINDAPQIDRVTKKPRIWTGRPIIDKQTGAVLLNRGDTVKKWTTAGGIPLPGLIKRRATERAGFEEGCSAW